VTRGLYFPLCFEAFPHYCCATARDTVFAVSPHRNKKNWNQVNLVQPFSFLWGTLLIAYVFIIFEVCFANYEFICFATSAAKSSLFFSRPSPVSKRTNFLITMFALFAFATSSTYFDTTCLPSSALTYT